MLGFHRRTRSLIPVGDLARYDKPEVKVEFEEVCDEEEDAGYDIEMSQVEEKQRQRRLMIVYVILFAEA